MSDARSKRLGCTRAFLNKLLFELSTPQGKAFNHAVIIIILLAVFLSMLDTVDTYHEKWGETFDVIQQWVLIAFAIEYALRLYTTPMRLYYFKSFNGIVDLVTILPLFIGIDGNVVIRLLRLVRVVKVAFYFPVVRALFSSLQGAQQMLLGVLGTIAMISILMGNLVYILEPQTYADAFEGAWWSLVTMSTVGYGDFVPQTLAGRLIATILIMSGICMFAMVTAVISVRVGRMANLGTKCVECNRAISSEYTYCPHCSKEQSDDIMLFGDED
ncbi:MAG: ion transporter [Ghiorsea sp.]